MHDDEGREIEDFTVRSITKGAYTKLTCTAIHWPAERCLSFRHNSAESYLYTKQHVLDLFRGES